MTNRTLQMNDALYDYLITQGTQESAILAELRQETASDEMSRMQIAPEQGQFLSFLVQLCGARKALEVGTYTGYSSICIASALPQDGQLICCDISETWTAIARRYWRRLRLEPKINLCLGDAQQTLKQLLDQGEQRTFDFIFIDADKEHYVQYYELAYKLLRSGGLLVIDNVLWSGRVADIQVQDNETRAIRKLNRTVMEDRRVSCSLLPIADGLMLVRKH